MFFLIDNQGRATAVGFRLVPFKKNANLNSPDLHQRSDAEREMPCPTTVGEPLDMF